MRRLEPGRSGEPSRERLEPLTVPLTRVSVPYLTQHERRVAIVEDDDCQSNSAVDGANSQVKTDAQVASAHQETNRNLSACQKYEH